MTLACGGQAMNTFEDMDESCLGYAGVVYEHVLGENKFTFVEECKNPLSVTILLRAGNKHTLTQMKVCCSIFSSDLSFNTQQNCQQVFKSQGADKSSDIL